MFDADHLDRIKGTFETASGTKLVVDAWGDQLRLTIPGQPTFTLESHLIGGRFVISELRTFSLGFVFDQGEQAVMLRLHQPGSVLEGKSVA